MTTDRHGSDEDDDKPDPQAGADPTDTEKRQPVDPEQSIDTEQHPDIA